MESLFVASLYMILSNKRIIKALIRLRGCAGWYVPLLFANTEYRFSRVEAQIESNIRAPIELKLYNNNSFRKKSDTMLDKLCIYPPPPQLVFSFNNILTIVKHTLCMLFVQLYIFSALSSCPSGWIKFEDKCYRIEHSTQRTWQDARVCLFHYLIIVSCV